MRKETVLIFSLLVCGVSLMAQNTMRVHYKDGRDSDISISQIDSVTFIEKVTLEEEVTLIGSWLWGNQEQGYYELLTINEDHTYTGYDNYFTYGFDTTTYGWYSWYGNMLTLQSNGFGYQRLYRWFVTALSGNALEVMTKTGSFTYYKLQPEVLHVSLSEPYTGFADGDTVVFTDGVTVSADGNKLLGLGKGTTYVLVKMGSDGRVLAYRVVVT